MKKLPFLLLSIFFYASAFSQNITLRFEGANKTGSPVQNYEVDLDGEKYYSSDADVISTRVKEILVEDLALGSHKLGVYKINSTSTASKKSSLVYSKSFQLRDGYDMTISIRGNGQVSFTEKLNTANTAVVNTTAKTAMSDAAFDKLLTSTKAKWSQTTRFTDIKTAINNKANFFSTEQVGQLLLLLTSEPRRLELAKLSYPKVTDPENFSDVKDLFAIQANQDNIEKFILSKNPANTSPVIINSKPPLTTQQFNQLVRTVKNQYEQSGKYAVLRDAFNVNTNYFTTSQLRQLLPLITVETERLALAKQAYARASDSANYSSLTDLFTMQSNRDELLNYIRYGETTSTTIDYSNRIAMSGGEFSNLLLKAQLHFRESSVVEDVRKAFSNPNNYFNIEQTRSLLSLVRTETEKLMLAKLAYHRVTDPTAFPQLFDLFTQASINDLNSYIKANRS